MFLFLYVFLNFEQYYVVAVVLSPLASRGHFILRGFGLILTHLYWGLVRGMDIVFKLNLSIKDRKAGIVSIRTSNKAESCE